MMTGTSGRISFTFGSISSPVMPGMLMSDRIRISDARCVASIRASASAAELREIHHEALRAQVAPELLAKQRLDVGLVIDHQNQNAHV